MGLGSFRGKMNGSTLNAKRTLHQTPRFESGEGLLYCSYACIVKLVEVGYLCLRAASVG
jgi:hypothetical protein